MQYKIQYGDTLSAIAKRNNITVEELARANGINDPNRIIAGDTIEIPDAGTGVTQQTTAAGQNAVTGTATADADLPDWLQNEPGWGTGTQSQSAAQQQTQTQVQGGSTIDYPTVPTYTPTQYQAYDPNTNAAYLQAMQALQQAQQNMPTYQNSYDGQIQDIYNKIMNREDFSYDLSGDMLYQQYLDQAVRTGRLAMMDSMGQAASLTGGYGSSYAQSVGQQQYDAYLQSLNDVVPELYGMARDAYDAEGQELLNLYSLTTDRANEEYSKYRDQMSDYYNNLNFALQQANTAYDRGADAYYRGIEFQQDAEQAAYQNQLAQYENQMQQWQWQQSQEETAYNRQNDAYDRLVTLITSTGYTPSQEELDAAGMTANEAQSWQGYYQQSITPKYSGGGGGSSSSATDTGIADGGGVVQNMLRFGNDAQAYEYLISQGYSVSATDQMWELYQKQKYKGALPEEPETNVSLTPVDTRTLEEWVIFFNGNGFQSGDLQQNQINIMNRVEAAVNNKQMSEDMAEAVLQVFGLRW